MRARWDNPPRTRCGSTVTFPVDVDGNSVATININQKLSPSSPASTPEGSSVLHAGSWFADLDSSFAFGGGTLMALTLTFKKHWVRRLN